MKNMRRKPYCWELFWDYIMFGIPVLILGGFVLFKLMEIAAGKASLIEGTRFIVFSIMALFAIILLAGVFLYKRSAAQAIWYHGILDSIPVPVIVTDKNVVWRQVNQAAREVLDMEQDDGIARQNSRHLLGADGSIMHKIWIHKGIRYRVSGIRFRCGGKDEGYLIFINGMDGLMEFGKTRSELVNEINTRLKHLSVATDHFCSYANSLFGHTLWQAGIITDLSEVVAGIATGTLCDSTVLSEKMRVIKSDMQNYMDHSRTDMEQLKHIVKEMDAMRNAVGGMLQDNADSDADS